MAGLLSCCFSVILLVMLLLLTVLPILYSVMWLTCGLHIFRSNSWLKKSYRKQDTKSLRKRKIHTKTSLSINLGTEKSIFQTSFGQDQKLGKCQRKEGKKEDGLNDLRFLYGREFCQMSPIFFSETLAVNSTFFPSSSSSSSSSFFQRLKD